MSKSTLDLGFCRAEFPPLANGWVYFENAGGTYVPRSVIDAMDRFMRECQCQPGWEFPSSRSARERLQRSQALLAEAINAGRDEIVIGPSTTLNVYVLANALRPQLAAGDEIVVTNQDHEANSGAWRRLEEFGVVVREWRIDPVTGDLDPGDLDDLLNERTRLVCFPHVSNIVGSVNDVAEITARAHAVDAMVCVDGVATVAHDLPDMKALDVDFYLFSLYKLYGPHLATLYGKRERIASLRNQNHFFVENQVPEVIHPGGLNYESTAAAAGIVDYFEAVYSHHFGAEDNSLRARIERVYALFRSQESSLMERLLEHLRERPGVRLIGRDTKDAGARAPTISLTVDGHRPQAIAEALLGHEIAVGHGHFYGYRCVQGLDIDPDDGVLRISMVHYNTLEEVDRLVDALEQVL